MNYTDKLGLLKPELTDKFKLQDLNTNWDILDDTIRPLSQNLTIYVSPAGDDTTGDGSELSPYKTIQHAIDTIPKALGVGNVTIQLAAGTYAGNIVVCGFSGGNSIWWNVSILGATTRAGAGDYIIAGSVIVVSCACAVRIRGVKVSGGAWTTITLAAAPPSPSPASSTYLTKA